MRALRLFDRIVIGYNASFAAHAALRCGLSLAQDADARLTVIAVAREPLGTKSPLQPYTTPIELDHQRCRAWLRAAEAYATEADSAVEAQVWTGPVHQALANAAASEQADLIIIGSPAHPQWRPNRIGALLVRCSPCPVLSVPC